MLELETSPERVRELFGRDRAAHVYGLADLEEPFWSWSRWWWRPDAAVGCVTIPEAALPIVYAIAARDRTATLDLLRILARSLPDRFLITGPPGLSDALSDWFNAAWHGPHLKMVLKRPGALVASSRTGRVHPSDLTAIRHLFDSDPRPDQFFVPQLLESGTYRGVWLEGRLVAVAGTHVVSQVNGVAAIGNVVTHPYHRRQGLGRETTSAVARDLLDSVTTVGLNVDATSVGARRLYESIGFDAVLEYEEAELMRAPGA